MAILGITEYDKIPMDVNGRLIPTGNDARAAYQELAVGAGSVQSVALSAATRFVRLHTDVPCRVEFGPNPTAVVGSSPRMAGNTTEYYGVTAGNKIAVITSA